MQYNQPFDQPSLPNAPFVNGNPGNGVAGSIPPAAQMEFPQRELVNATMAASLSPTNGDMTQLAQAMSIGLWLGAMGGSANALADTLPSLATTSDGVTQYAIPALAVGMTFHGIIPATNGGPATLTLTGFATPPGAKPILTKAGAPVQAGDLPAGAIVSWRYDGTGYRVTSVVQSDILAIVLANQQTNLISGGRYASFTFGGGSWVCPAGVFTVRARLWGGGAGGGGCLSTTSSSGGSGGGSGQYAEGTFSVVPGQAYAYGVGAGGGGGSGPQPGAGGGGGTTSFGGLISAAGGGGGAPAANAIQNTSAGSGGSGGSAPFILNGGSGGFATLVSSGVVFGGVGASCPFGGALSEKAANYTGASGQFPGGGGGGGANGSTSGNANGGAGAGGLIQLIY